jgi:hypothetical protein
MRSKGQNWSLAVRRQRLEELRLSGLDRLCGQALERVAIYGINEVRLRPSVLAEVPDDPGPIRPAPARKPPDRPLLARLIASRGLALRLYLTALYEAQVRQRPGSLHTNDRPLWPDAPDEIGWIGLLAVTASVTAKGRSTMDNRLRQVKSAIERLVGEGAFALPFAARPRNKFEHFLLRNDSETQVGLPAEHIYITPRRNEGVGIPIEFYTNNWLHCLTDSEIALWLSLRLVAKENPAAHREAGVFMASSTRQHRFGLTRDAYEAHAALRHFGLIKAVDIDARRRAGRSEVLRQQGLVEPFRFVLNDPALRDLATGVLARRFR